MIILNFIKNPNYKNDKELNVRRKKYHSIRLYELSNK